MNINIVCQNKKIRVDKVCQIEDSTTDNHLVLYCDCCPYVGTDEGCNKCYGRIAQNIIKKDGKETKNIVRDKYTLKNNELKRILEATALIENMIVVAEISNINGPSSTAKPWTAYDRPSTWRVDCSNCIERCKLNNEMPMCKNTKQNLENGNPANFCNIQKQRKIYIY